MKHLVALALLLSAPGVLAPTPAHAQSVIEDRDPVGENIRAEAEAIRYMAQTVRAEIDSGELTLSDQAMQDWEKGRELWNKIREEALAEQYGPAYKTARRGRHLIRNAFRHAFLGKPSKALVDALKAYMDAVKPRVAAIDNQIIHYKLTLEGREAYHVAKAMYGDARKSAKKKKWDAAFRELFDAMAEYDKVIYETYPTSR